MAQINPGNGPFGKIVKDPGFAQKLDDHVTNLDNLLKGINEGKGTAGQLVQNRALYDHLDQTADQAQQLIKGMREDPKKYLVDPVEAVLCRRGRSSVVRIPTRIGGTLSVAVCVVVSVEVPCTSKR